MDNVFKIIMYIGLRQWKRIVITILLIFGILQTLGVFRSVLLPTENVREISGNYTTGMRHPVYGMRICKPSLETHVAVITTGSSEDLDVTIKMMTSLLIHRTCNVTFHVFTDDRGTLVIGHLFQTWQLPAVKLNFYKTDESKINDELLITRFMAELPLLLPTTLNKVVYISKSMRLVEDIRSLWDEMLQFITDQFYGLIAMPDGTASRRFIDVILMDLESTRANYSYARSFFESAQSWTSFQQFFNSHSSNVYNLNCAWSLRPEDNFPFEKCLPANAVYWNSDLLSVSGLPMSHPVSRLINRVDKMDSLHLDLLSGDPDLCLTNGKSLERVKNPPDTMLDAKVQSKCSLFIEAGRERLRTHLNFMSFRGTSPDRVRKTAPKYDVTLATVMTIDRFLNFLRFIEYWDGPISTVVYCGEEEVNAVKKLFMGSTLVQERNVTVHLVYKRNQLFLINHLRNVAINQSYTSHTFFVDVDLVPSQYLYNDVINYINNRTQMKCKEAIVVASFESRIMFADNAPKTKTQLLPYLSNGNVTGFKMYRKWNLGHKPTDFKKWKSTDKFYNVTYRDAFEPYVVIPTSDMPRYEESLLERMGDKISYGLHVYSMGYTFTVIPNSFILHLMHPKSPGNSLWARNGAYRWCGGKMMEAFKNKMKRTYPNMNFKGKL